MIMIIIIFMLAIEMNQGKENNGLSEKTAAYEKNA